MPGDKFFLPESGKYDYKKPRQNKDGHLTMVSFDKLKGWHELGLWTHLHEIFWGIRREPDISVFARCFGFYLLNAFANTQSFDSQPQRLLLADVWSNLDCSENETARQDINMIIYTAFLCVFIFTVYTFNGMTTTLVSSYHLGMVWSTGGEKLMWMELSRYIFHLDDTIKT